MTAEHRAFVESAEHPLDAVVPTLGPMSIEFLARRVAEHAEERAAQIIAAAQAT